MNVRIHPSWASALAPEFAKPYFAELAAFVRQEYAAGPCYPPAPLVFNALDSCPLDRVRVVILGQDPYHEPGQAHGLCFSVQPGVQPPPSLVNIYKEISSDLGVPMPSDGCLQRWADQGVLLLNATLTVRAHQAGSHQRRGWETFTDAVIAAVSREREHVVFMLWGGYARGKLPLIDQSRHLVLQAVHPSPLSANRGGWFGNRHFSKANAYLRQWGKGEVVW